MATGMENKYTLDDISKRLKVSTRTLLREIKRGKLKSQRVGRRHLVSEVEIESYLGKGRDEDYLEKTISMFLKDVKVEMISTLQKMVSRPSVASEVGQEAKLANLIKHKFDKWGIRSNVYEEGSEVAVRASYGLADDGILLDSPLDTLPPGDLVKWTYPPFDGVIRKGKMYGRGTADCKAGIVAMMYTILFFRKFFDEEKLRIEVVFDGGEQDGSFAGMKLVLKRGLPVTAGIVGYAGDMKDILVGARGYHRYCFTIHGEAVHTGSRYKPGINAISKMTKFINEVESYEFPKPLGSLFSFGGRLTFSKIEGGRAINMVPDSCSAWLDVRTTPEISKDRLDEDLAKIIDKIKVRDKNFKIDVQYMVGQQAYMVNPKGKIVELIGQSCQVVLNRKMYLTASGPAHVGNLLNESNIPTVVFGPMGENVHSYDEYIEISSIPKVVEIYIRTIIKYFDIDSNSF